MEDVALAGCSTPSNRFHFRSPRRQPLDDRAHVGRCRGTAFGHLDRVPGRRWRRQHRPPRWLTRRSPGAGGTLINECWPRNVTGWSGSSASTLEHVLCLAQEATGATCAAAGELAKHAGVEPELAEHPGIFTVHRVRHLRLCAVGVVVATEAHQQLNDLGLVDLHTARLPPSVRHQTAPLLARLGVAPLFVVVYAYESRATTQ